MKSRKHENTKTHKKQSLSRFATAPFTQGSLFVSYRQGKNLFFNLFSPYVYFLKKIKSAVDFFSFL